MVKAVQSESKWVKACACMRTSWRERAILSLSFSQGRDVAAGLKMSTVAPPAAQAGSELNVFEQLLTCCRPHLYILTLKCFERSL